MTARVAGSPGRARAVLVVGLGLLALAILWWLIYYAQWEGMFALIDVKLGCLAGDSFECTNFRDFIGSSALPVYSPWLFWLGVIVAVLGLYLTRRNKA